MSEPLLSLLDEVRRCWHVLLAAGERLHAEEPVTMGMRAVLEQLSRFGPATVPSVARARGVSRQHVQTLVNPLAALGLVRFEDNPASRRSPLVALTREGRLMFRRMKRAEAGLLMPVAKACPASEWRQAAATLRKLRLSLEARP
ncbi:MAG: MarR family transcriptional regulator [Acidobacteria bacterium]|nr:MarR family transcriptional regulator [Acidobacteriota bacterium]